MAHRDIMHTSNAGYDYSFCWTIDDFHHTSLVVQGPAFMPIPGCSDKFCFEVQFKLGTVDSSCFYLNLLHLTSNIPYRTVRYDVNLENKTDHLCGETLNGGIKIEKCTNLMTYDIFPANDISEGEDILSLFGLADGKLTLHGSLTFTGFLVTSSIYSITVPKSLEDCGELAKDFTSLYESGFGSDVTFSVGDKLYPAHKLVLGARSVVFAKMFEHKMLESNTNNVTIEDIDPDTFNKFLLFLYTGCLEGYQPDSVVNLYAVAKKYQVQSLHKACLVMLGNSLSVDSFCESLMVADLYEDENFKGMVKVFFRENFCDVVGTPMWAEIVTNRPALAKEVLDFIKPVYK